MVLYQRFLCGMVFTGLMLFAPTSFGQQGVLSDQPDEARILLLQSKPRAYAVVEQAGLHSQARIRLAAIEAAEFAPDAALDLARNGLADENPAVRFAALVTVGKLKLTGLSQAALDLMRDENESVRAAAIFAAKRTGRDVDLSPLGRMLASGRASSRANAAMLVGMLGDRQATEMLQDMAAQPMPRVSPAERTWVRLQFAEAMIRLDPDNAEVLGTIRAAMYSNLNDVRVLSMQILGDVGDRSVRAGLAHIIKRSNPIQVKIAAAQALVRMGDPQGGKLLIDASTYRTPRLRKDLGDYLREIDGASPEGQAIQAILADPKRQAQSAAEVRAQAARALGYMDSNASAKRLSKLLDDPDPVVQVAAAAALLRASR